MTTRLVSKTGVPAREPHTSVTPSISLWGGIRYVLGLWRRYRLQAVVAVCSLIVHELFRTYFALRLKTMVDSLQETGVVENLATIMLVLVLGFFVALTARLFGEQLIAETGVKILSNLRLRMFEHLQQLSHSYYTRMTSSNILSRFSSDLADVEKVVTLKLRDGLMDIILLGLNLPVLFYIDWRLGLVPIVNIVLMTYVVGYFAPKAASAGYALKIAEAQLTGELQETIRGQALIRAFGFEPQMLARFRKELAVVEETGAHASLMRALVALSARSIVLFSRVISVGIGVWLVMQNLLTVGELVAFLNLFTLVNNAIDDITRTVLPDFIGVTSGIQRIEELLQETPDIVEQKGATTLAPLRRQIRLQQVSFSYTGQTNQLHEIDLTIPAGKTVAIVGPSGSGKSTLLMLLMRSRDATTGTIAYDGVDLRKITRASLQKQMSVVFQETYLFDTTIRENIRMAKPSATDAEVEQAAKLAEVHDSIMALPGRYEAQVGETGGRLSGGQRQRIAIARAIIRNPTILILDEATSALDPSAEAAINATLQRLGRSRTVISVTHRLSSVTQVDYIVVLNGGRLVEAGKHSALLKEQGLYAQMWEKQSGFDISADGRTAKVHASYLRQVALFSGLDTEVLSRIASRFNTQYVNQGQVVFEQGDAGDRFYLIARGQVEVLARNVQGEAQKIDTMGDGDHFGETALVQDAPRNATIRTVTDCLFLTLPKREFLALLEELPPLRLAVSMQIERTLLNRERQNVDPETVAKKASVPQKVSAGVRARVTGWWSDKTTRRSS